MEEMIMLGCPKCGRVVNKLYWIKAQTESQCTECFTKYTRSKGINLAYMGDSRIGTEPSVAYNQPGKKPRTNYNRYSSTSGGGTGGGMLEEEELLQG